MIEDNKITCVTIMIGDIIKNIRASSQEIKGQMTVLKIYMKKRKLNKAM